MFANGTNGRALRGFRNHPVKIWGVVGDEPDASSIRGAVLWQFDDRLYQGDSFYSGPTGRACNATSGAIGANNVLGMQSAALATLVDFHAKAIVVGAKTKELGVVFQLRTCLLRFF